VVNPYDSGTLVFKDVDVGSKENVKAITIIDVVLVTISGSSIINIPRVISRISDILTKNDINVLMTS